MTLGTRIKEHRTKAKLSQEKVAELVGGHILTHQGSPTIAQERDKRPKYDQTAETINDLNS